MPGAGQFGNREAWLTALAKELESLIIERTSKLKVVPKIVPYRIACGWPSRRGTANNHRRIGECWPSQASRGGVHEMFISPTLGDVAEIAHVTAHEMLHAFLPPGVGHRKPFSQAAKAIGLSGKPTATVAGTALTKTLKAITDKLGPYPHDELRVTREAEKSRNLKFVCPDCGWIGRTSAYWLARSGPPICAECGVQMTEDEGEAAESPLELIDQNTTFQLPGNERFQIVRTITSKAGDRRRLPTPVWKIIDFFPEENGSDVAARHTAAESREHAIEMIDGLMTGEITYTDLEVSDELIEDTPLDGHLDDHEDEVPDYPEDQLTPEEQEAEEILRRREAIRLVRDQEAA